MLFILHTSTDFFRDFGPCFKSFSLIFVFVRQTNPSIRQFLSYVQIYAANHNTRNSHVTGPSANQRPLGGNALSVWQSVSYSVRHNAAVVAELFAFLTQMLRVDLALIRHIQTIRLVQRSLQSQNKKLSCCCDSRLYCVLANYQTGFGYKFTNGWYVVTSKNLGGAAARVYSSPPAKKINKHHF